ncbi:MAG: PAS domain-containing protein, partial [Bacteroidales bacterium]|nr:PAS domain-containing protein [Bacteroidales bacterium]
ITLRKETEKVLRFHSVLIDNISDFVTASDLRGYITYVNQTVCKTFQKRAEELMGQHVSFFGDDSSVGGVAQQQIVSETIEKGNWNGEVVNIAPNGQKIYLFCRTQLFYDENDTPTGMVGISTDITAKKHQERQLEELNRKLSQQNIEYLAMNEELEDSLQRIQQINIELEMARLKAEESDKLKSAFLANMSHEIRTPLNGILGFTELLCDQPNIDTDQRERFAGIIKKSATGLLQIIDDVLDISHLESGMLEIKPKPFDVNNLLLDLYAMYNNLLSEQNKNITLKCRTVNSKLFINSDEVRVRQVFSNLLNNAIKFTERGSIEFGVETTTKKHIRFFVSDTGIGIKKDLQHVIFERFRQGDAANNRPRGATASGFHFQKPC